MDFNHVRTFDESFENEILCEQSTQRNANEM